ncbi:alpha/beta fold hydrolase [Diplocloster agilis]|uniref:alpha/beta fold hydrolase n=1 Tax=Diplocloster agilis TaxID=2850323 RepID=UPI0008204610|nr:alpha/beta hydrolase [Suonthocola fibrivorans]MCU6734484.1 alpha/beta hydrolase [Suonthocola fibrivorans]SCJ41548.1 short chain dehydrogenase [uncultured Clostridium sp.]
MHIDEQSKMNLNGVPQFVSIRAEKENSPLLVYLHGGPGDAALPLVMKYNKMLEQQFTVVVWEQRGAGKSYYKFEGPVTIDIFLNDLHTLVDQLLSRFHQSSLYLVGHSWGSILGLRFVEAYPELVRTYIGCGQVVNMRKSSRAAYDYALAHADKKSLEKLREIDCSYQADSWLNDLLFVTKQVVKHKGSLYGKRNYLDLVLPFLFSPYYTGPDLIRRQKGSLQAIQYLWQEVMQTDFEAQTKYGAPILLIEGRYDSHVSSALAKEYFDRIETEKQFYWFEKSCHFPQWSESEKFNKLLCGLPGSN